MSVGNFPEVLSQRILVGIVLVGRLGVCCPGRVLQGLRVDVRRGQVQLALLQGPVRVGLEDAANSYTMTEVACSFC